MKDALAGFVSGVCRFCTHLIEEDVYGPRKQYPLSSKQGYSVIAPIAVANPGYL
jgi:hypothetical protein